MTYPQYILQKPSGEPLQVLIPIYPDFNTFDANGPIEILSGANRHSGGTQHFKLTITSATENTTAIEQVRIARDISLTEALARVGEWDILLLPGGTVKGILSQVSEWKEKKEGGGSELLQLLNSFMGDPEKLTFTICTGSLFLGALGRLNGRRATTHFGQLATLKSLCAESADSTNSKSKAEIVRARWVDSGNTDKEGPSRIITAGGVSCGLDAALHLVNLIAGHELAEKVSRGIEYQPRGEELQVDYVI